MCPSSSWQQSLCVGGSGRGQLRSAWCRRSLKTELTVRESASEQKSDGCTACTETPWKPNCWESLGPTTGRQLGGAGSQSFLEGAERRVRVKLLFCEPPQPTWSKPEVVFAGLWESGESATHVHGWNSLCRSVHAEQLGRNAVGWRGRVTFQEGRNVSELGDAILSVPALLLQLLQAVQELPAGQAGVNTAQLPVHLPPLTTASHQGRDMSEAFQHILRCSFFSSPCGQFFCCVLHRG